jgi:hypothetical protein
MIMLVLLLVSKQFKLHNSQGKGMAEIIWKLDLHLPMQLLLHTRG